MTSREDSIIYVTSAIAVVIAIVVTTAIPAAYFMISYQYKGGSMDAQAELSARSVEGLVMANPKMWQFEEIRLQELLQRRHNLDVPEVRQIRDAQGNIVAEVSESPSRPLIKRDYDIYDAGVPMARIELSQSLRPLIARTAIVGSLSFLLGILIFIVLRTVPLKAVRKAYQSKEESEGALRQSEERFRSLFENSPVPVWEEDFSEVKHFFDRLRKSGINDMKEYLDSRPEAVKECAALVRILNINEESLHFFNVGRKEEIPSNLPQFFTDESLAVFKGELISLSEGKTRLTMEIPIRVIAGDIRLLMLNLSVVPGYEETLAKVHVTFIDITERKQVEDELRLSRQRLSLHIQQTPLAVVEFDLEGRVRGWNPAAAGIFGYTSEEAIGRHWTFMVPESVWGSLEGVWEELVARRGGSRSTNDNLTKDGRIISCEWFSTPLVDPGDKTIGVASLVMDVTERKQAEEKLRQREEFIRTILDTVDEGFIVIDRDYRILTVNKAYCSQAGECDEKIIGSHCYEISHKIDRPCYDEGEDCAVRQVFDTGRPHSAIHHHKDADGNILYVETKAYPIHDASGAVTSVIETITNITEKHLLEEERLKTQKLESIGRLAGGIAHDFNNLLQGVFGYISMAKITIDQREKSLSMLEQAEEALHLSVNLTTQLLTFSKGGKPIKKLIRLKPAVENAVKFALSGSHTNYEMVNPSALWPVEADEGQVAQVIQNIVLNANEAMAGSGTVHVSLENVDIAKGTMVGLPDGGQFVRIAIQDSGIGIPEQNMAKIFDPYFTTKQKGSGLGLATSYSIIKNHGGLIEVESEINRGTAFTIYLPAARGAEMETAQITSYSVGTRHGRILLMDDEELVRRVAQEMLAAMGNDLVSAENGEKAVELFRQAREAGSPFDLVILDLTVKGGMGGEEAIRKIRDIDPDVKAVVSSGYADSPVVADYRTYGFSAVLNKPFKIEDLQNCLNLFIT